jgi:hypothetical protein
MSRIFTSATKIVLLLVSLTACAGFILKLIEPKDFMTVVMLVLGAYYGASNTRPDEVNTPYTTTPPPAPVENVTSTLER